ncbi:hypothetical protein LTR17_017386 [Elasticomyces elasticus]|nr:hypothetical protein LTR17_017386 [Elasticomyces elasticus]
MPQDNFFDNLCGPEKKFAEGTKPEIELWEDDEEGVEAMLRWLYTFDYEDHFHQHTTVEGTEETDSKRDANPKNTLDLHLSVCVVADKYELLDLHNEALTRFRKGLENADENEVSRMFGAVREEGSTYAQSIIDVVNVVRDIRLQSLLQNTDFRALLSKDSALCMEALDRMLESKGQQRTPEFSDAYLQRSFFKCTVCPRSEMQEASRQAMVCTSRTCMRDGVQMTRHVVYVKK